MSKHRSCPSYNTPILFDSHPMDEYRDRTREKKKPRTTSNPSTFAEVASENGFIIKDAIGPRLRVRI